MIAGKKYFGLDVDIWSSGVTLYAMLVGYLPFEDPDTALLYKKILIGSYEEPTHLSVKARQMLKAVLQTNPEKRANIAEIRNHPWVQSFEAKKKVRSVKSSVSSSLSVSRSVSRTPAAVNRTQMSAKKPVLKVGMIDLTAKDRSTSREMNSSVASSRMRQTPKAQK